MPTAFEARTFLSPSLHELTSQKPSANTTGQFLTLWFLSLCGKIYGESFAASHASHWPRQFCRLDSSYLISVDHTRPRNILRRKIFDAVFLSRGMHTLRKDIAQQLKPKALSLAETVEQLSTGTRRKHMFLALGHVGEASCRTRQACFPTCCCCC